MSHFRTIILVVLPLLSIVGAYGTWVLGFRNGLFVDITSLLKQNNALFPGSTAPLLRQYTGITPIDHQLQILVTFFSPVVDGKNPELMLFSILGAGQFGGAWALLMMESLRLGNRGKIISFGIHPSERLLCCDRATISISPSPYLSHRSTKQEKHQRSSDSDLGFGNHSNLALPWLYHSYDLNVLAGICNYSPTVHSVLATISHLDCYNPLNTALLCFPASPLSKADAGAPTKTHGESYLDAAAPVYRFVFALCMITHIPVLAIIRLSPTTLLGYSPILTHLLKSTFTDVFVPYGADVNPKSSGLTAGALNFLQWDLYIGSAALLLWMSVLYRDAATQSTMEGLNNKGAGWKLAQRIVTYTLISGPVGAISILLAERDSIVKQKTKKGI